MGHRAYPHSIKTGNVSSYNLMNCHNNIVNANKDVADKSPEIRQWLSPLDPRRRHQDVRAERLNVVGNLILETNQFRGVGEIRLSNFTTGTREWGRYV